MRGGATSDLSDTPLMTEGVTPRFPANLRLLHQWEELLRTKS